MSAFSISPPFPIFTDIDGQPLENGYIWIGTTNLNPIVNPINVYWDAALTVAAVQPIRTLAGYPSNSGTPARLYVNSDYSIQVQNRNGSVVYSAPAATEAFGNLINASQVVYNPAGTGAVATTVQTKLRESVSIEDYGGAAGAGDNTAAMNAAEAYLATLGGGIIVIPYPGEWRMNWVCNTNNITVHGAGGKGEFDLNCIRPYSSASAAITIGDGVTQTRYCGLYNLHISGTDQTAGAISTATGNAPDALAVRGGVYDLHIDKCVLYNGIRTLSMIPTNGGESITGITVTRTHIRNDLDGVATARAVYLARYENNVTSPDLGYLTAVNFDNCRVNGPRNGGWIAHCAQLGNVGIVFSVTNSYWDCSPDYGVKLEGSSGIVCHNFQLDPGTSGAIVVETDSNGDIARFIVGNFRIGGQKFRTPAYTYTLAAEADTFNYRARLNTPFLSPTFYLSQTEDPYNTTTYFDRTTASNSAPLRFNGADFYVAKDIYGYGGNGSTAWYLTANSVNGGAYLAALGTNQNVRLVPSGTGSNILAGAGTYPSGDNTQPIGLAGQRWSVVYAGTGAINTSDAREKQQIRSLSDAENAVAVRLKSLIKAFKFNDAVQAKGDAARIHVGVIAQEVIAAFEAEGLDANRYAIVCYDEWAAELDDDGNEVRPAGNRYGVRYEELLAFIISAL